MKKNIQELYISLSRRALLRGAFFVVLLSLLSAVPVKAQETAGTQDTATVEKVPFKNKIGIRTNVIDWLFTLPNIGVEMEVGKSKYYKNPYTISIVGRYNWQAWSRYKPSMVFNIADVRIEGRKYWNTQGLDKITTKEIKDGIEYRRSKKYSEDMKNAKTKEQRDSIKKVAWSRPEYLWKYAFKMDRVEPRTERGYYAGVYLGYHNYSIKFGGTGRQGNAFSGGLTAGFTIPLYSYRDRFIDLDMGGSVGICYSKYDEYGYDAESDCYPVTAVGKTSIMPCVAELRVALVYRFETVRKKMPLTDKQGRQDRLNYLSGLKIQRERDRDSVMQVRAHRRDSIAKVRAEERALKQFNDSIEGLRRDSMRLEKKMLDSIAEYRKDSAKLAKAAEKALRDSLERIEERYNDSIKLAEKLAKKAAKQQGDSVTVETPTPAEGAGAVNETLQQVAGELENVPDAQIEVVPAGTILEPTPPDTPAEEGGGETPPESEAVENEETGQPEEQTGEPETGGEEPAAGEEEPIIVIPPLE